MANLASQLGKIARKVKLESLRRERTKNRLSWERFVRECKKKAEETVPEWLEICRREADEGISTVTFRISGEGTEFSNEFLAKKCAKLFKREGFRTKISLASNEIHSLLKVFWD